MPLRHFVGAALIGAALAAMPAPAVAQDFDNSGTFKNGDDIFALCTSSEELEIATCEFFLMGAHDMAKFYDDRDGNGSFCTPDGFNAAQLRELMVAFWQADPSTQEYSASSVVHHVLSARFPGRCQTQGPPEPERRLR